MTVEESLASLTLRSLESLWGMETQMHKAADTNTEINLNKCILVMENQILSLLLLKMIA